jgi:hypothetical protein
MKFWVDVSSILRRIEREAPISLLLTHTYLTLRLLPPQLAFTKGAIMTRRRDWVQVMGFGATVFAMAALAITDDLQWMSAPAYATERGEERRGD